MGHEIRICRFSKPLKITGLATGDCLSLDSNSVLTTTGCGAGGGGTVTSVGLSAPTGLSVSGSPVISSGTLALSLASGYVIPLTASTTDWNTAYLNRITSASSPLSISGSAISCATCLTAAITAIGPAGQTQSGAAVTLATSTSATNGITSAIKITGSGDTLTFQPSQSGTLTVAGGGTGATTFTGGRLLFGNGTGAMQTVATSTPTFSSPLTTLGTPGAWVGGSGYTIGCQTASGSQAGCLSSTDWTTFNGKQASGNYLTALTGDVTASGPGSAAATLATVNANVGSFTNANITVNAKGLITAASNGSAAGTIGTSTPLVNGQVDFSTGVNTIGNDSAFVWDNSNKRLGLGISTPTSTLHVKGSTNAITSQITNAAGNEFLRFAYSDDASNYYGNFQIQPSALVLKAGNASNGRIELQPYNGGVYSAGLGLTVASTGYVGVGSSSPTNIMTVNAPAANAVALHLTRNNASGDFNTAIMFDGASNDVYAGMNNNNAFAVNFNSPDLTTSPPFLVATTGFVGIGTSSPIAKLSVKGSGSAASDVALGAGSDNSAAWQLSMTTMQPSYFMKGNFGIGTTSPSAKLAVAGDILGTGNMTFSYNSNGNGIFGVSGAGNQIMSVTRQNSPTNASLAINSFGAIGFTAGNTSGSPSTAYQLYLTTAGNVGIGTTAPAMDLNIYHDQNGQTGFRIDNPNAGVTSSALMDIRNGGLTTAERLLFGITGSGYTAVAGWQDASVVASQSGLSGGLILNANAGGIKFETGGNGSTSQRMVIDNSGNVGIASSSPNARLSILGASSGIILNLFSSGGTKIMEVLNSAVTTLLGTWDFSGATVKIHQYASFSYSTSTAWTGSTTIALGPAYTAEQWNGVKCFTDAGTVNVSFSDGSNRMNLLNASTTVGTVALTTNNTFTAGEKRYVDVGTPASTPTKVSCTVDRTVNN